MPRLPLIALVVAVATTRTLVACSDTATNDGGTTNDPTEAGTADDDDDTADGAASSRDGASEAGLPDGGSIVVDEDGGDGGSLQNDSGSLEDAGEHDAGEDAGGDEEPPGPIETRLLGRWNTADGTGPTTSWPGSRAVARFEGTQVSASFDQLWGFASGIAYFDVLIDGVFVKKIALDDTARKNVGSGADGPMDFGSIELASGLAQGKHTVELVKRTEPNHGRITRFKGFTFAGGTQLAPPVAHTRRIEYLGDSTLDGYGVESAGGCGAYPYSASHNARLSFTQLLANSFDADAMILGYSGKGLVANESTTDTTYFPDLAQYVLPDYFPARVAWSFAGQVPDAVFISLGGTDYKSNRTTFNTKYGEFVDATRTRYANAHIYMLVGPQIKDGSPPGYNTRTDLTNSLNAVKAARAGDTKLHVFSFAIANTNIDGCASHPNATLHLALATEIRETVRADLGW